jgi:hypothetical protein
MNKSLALKCHNILQLGVIFDKVRERERVSEKYENYRNPIESEQQTSINNRYNEQTIIQLLN